VFLAGKVVERRAVIPILYQSLFLDLRSVSCSLPLAFGFLCQGAVFPVLPLFAKCLRIFFFVRCLCGCSFFMHRLSVLTSLVVQLIGDLGTTRSEINKTKRAVFLDTS